MPRFFFDAKGDGLSALDSEGSELADAEAASVLAHGVLTELVQHRGQAEAFSQFTAAVRDQARRVLYRATLTIGGQWGPDGSANRAPAA